MDLKEGDGALEIGSLLGELADRCYLQKDGI